MKETAATLENTNSWNWLYKIGGIASIISVVLIPIGVVFFIINQPPRTAIDYFTLFHKNMFLGLIALDLIYLMNNVLGLILFPTLCIALRHRDKSFLAIALIFGIVGSSSFFTSNTAFNMLYLSNQYWLSATEAQKALFLAAGESMLAIYQGTAYHMHYILGSLSLLIISIIMYRGKVFSKLTSIIGIVTNILVFGLYLPGIGMYLSLFSLPGYVVWWILIAQVFFKLGKTNNN